MRVICTTTWNSADVITTFLKHYRNLGFDEIVVMDFGSSDDTLKILSNACSEGIVTQLPFPGIAGIDSSNLMLNYARSVFASDTLCLFCDPDELLVLPSMDARRDLPLDLGGEDISGWDFPRTNMTCKRSLALASQGEMHAIGNLRYRAGGAERRDHVSLIQNDQLEPAWIFTQLPGKVLVKLSHTTAIGDGDHTATTTRALMPAPKGMRLLHYPFRTLLAFVQKIIMAKRDFAANTHRAPGWGWQVQRWIRLSEQGLLTREYFQQFPDDEDFERHVAEGRLTEDCAIIDYHAKL